MADRSLEPGGAPANLSRRTLIALPALAALPLPFPPPVTEPKLAWIAALGRYRASVTASQEYTGICQWAWMDMHAGILPAAAFDAVQEHADSLGDLAAACFTQLLATPAPNFAALHDKMRIVDQEYFRHEPQVAQIFAAIMSDFVQLTPHSRQA